VTGDKVGPHSDLLDEFPYLGPPHEQEVSMKLGTIGKPAGVVQERTVSNVDIVSGTRWLTADQAMVSVLPVTAREI